MTDPYVEDEINLRDYWRVLVRRRFLILGITFFAAVATVVIVLLMPNIYQSKTTLMPLGKSASGGLSGMLGELGGLLPIGSLTPESPGERILALLNSRTLAEDVIRRLDLLPRLFEKAWDIEKQQWVTDEPPTMQDAVRKFQGGIVTITSDKKTGVITIVAEHTDAELAATIANQVVDALQRLLDDNAFSLAKKNRLFIESRLKETRQSLKASEETLRSFEQKHGIVSLDAQTAASVFSLNQAPEVKLQYARLQREALMQNKLFTMLVEQLEQAKIEEARDETAFQVLDRAIPSEKRSRPKRRQTVMMATMVGFFLGVLSAFFREFLDTTIKTREQVQQQATLPVLAAVALPQSRKREVLDNSGTGLVSEHRVDSPLKPVEAFRYLYTRLRRLEDDQQKLQTIVVASPKADDNVLRTLVNLAMIAASSGEKVLLIDSNLQQPGLHREFRCTTSPGLSELLTDPEGWPKGVQMTAFDGLHFLPAGAPTPATGILLEGTICDTLMTRARATYDRILCAAPPVLDYADAAILGSKTDAVCLVLSTGRTKLEAVSEAREVLEAVQANIIGVVLCTQVK